MGAQRTQRATTAGHCHHSAAGNHSGGLDAAGQCERITADLLPQVHKEKYILLLTAAEGQSNTRPQPQQDIHSAPTAPRVRFLYEPGGTDRVVLNYAEKEKMRFYEPKKEKIPKRKAPTNDNCKTLPKL